jgi:phage tail-like protein
MPQVSAAARPADPYENFRFRVKFSTGTAYIAGVSKVSGLKRTTEVVKHREGGDPATSRKLPGRTEYEPITLERGVTQDLDFEQWANKVWSLRNSAGGMETSLKDFRRDIVIDIMDESGQTVLRYTVHNCWISEYQAAPEFDANVNAVAIQHIKLENEGWERDTSLPAPADVQFDDPAQ